MSGYIRNVISSYSAERAGNKCLLFLDVVYSKVILNQCNHGLINQVKDFSIMKPFHNIWMTSMYWLQIEFQIIGMILRSHFESNYVELDIIYHII